MGFSRCDCPTEDLGMARAQGGRQVGPDAVRAKSVPLRGTDFGPGGTSSIASVSRVSEPRPRDRHRLASVLAPQPRAPSPPVASADEAERSVRPARRHRGAAGRRRRSPARRRWSAAEPGRHTGPEERSPSRVRLRLESRPSIRNGHHSPPGGRSLEPFTSTTLSAARRLPSDRGANIGEAGRDVKEPRLAPAGTSEQQ
jgi:hypothetical protein